MKEKIYSVIFLISLAIFILNFILQGPISFGYSDDFGLITKLSPVFWVGYLGMIVVIYYHYINFKDIREAFVLLTLFLVTVYLIGTPFFYEILPRFEDSWFHLNLAEKIYETGKVRSTGNIYEQYPGSFLFYGLFFNFLPVYTFMKMFTILFYLFGLSVVYLIFKELGSSKTALLVTILYMFFSWTAEDNHISPQFLMLNLYIVFMFLLVKFMKNPDEWRVYGFLLLILILVFSFSHLFTQIFVFSTLGAFFVLVPKTRKFILPIFIFAIVLFVIHETVFTETVGTFRKDLMESIRNFSLSSFLSSPSERIGSETVSRKIFIWSRLTILGSSMILGLSGIVIMYLKGPKTEAKLLLAWSFSLIPFLVLTFLISRTEFVERFALVSSLPLAGGIGYLLSGKRLRVFVLIFLLTITPIYFVAKYGNESFESKSFQRLKADCYSLFFNPNCERKMALMHSTLDFPLEELGEAHSTVTREEVIGVSIYKNYGSVEDILEIIKKTEGEKGLMRVYSTNDAWSYVKIL